jgi:hypothetical protein
MKPVVRVCICGAVFKFGFWVNPTVAQLLSINSGTYQRNYEQCSGCAEKVKINREIFPMKVLR